MVLKPRIVYGSAKVRKPIIDNCYFCWSILSAIGAPTYNLAKFLVLILSPLTVNEFTDHDSFLFAEHVVNFDTNCIMASLGPENVSTNIPLYETIENCVSGLFSNNDTVHNFIKEDFKEILKFASYEWSFTFDNRYYSQLDDVAMGSALANAFLCHLEKQWLPDCSQSFCPNIYRRYVDDIFVTFKSHEQLKRFVEYMNIKRYFRT